MVGFAGLRTPYAVFIIVLMVIGIVAGGFFFYNSIQNPCGDPGPARFASLPAQTVTPNGQPKTYTAVAANFTGTQEEEVIAGVAFYTTAFNDPSIPHLINGTCASDHSTPASVTVRVTFFSSGQQVLLELQAFRGTTQPPVSAFTSDYQAGILWDSSVSSSLELLVAQ